MSPRPARLDLADPAFWTSPHGMLREARERGRTALTQRGERVLLRADDVDQVHSDRRFVNPGVANLERLGICDGPFYEWRARTLAVLEGDEHTRLRGFIGGAFTARRTGVLREAFRAHAEAVLADAARADPIDLVHDYAQKLPFFGICHFLGLPDSDREELEGFLMGTEEGFTEAMTPAIRSRAEASITALSDYVLRLVEDRSRQPRDDAISELVRAWEAERPVSRDEFLALVVNLIGGAVGSTRAAISNALFLLLSHPAQSARLREQPSLVRLAVEECLRLYPPFRIGRRVVAEAHAAFGLELATGDTLLIVRAAANRDPERFVDPDRFDIEREPKPHASFGHGTHFCLGQALARMEVQEAVLALLQRFPDAKLTGGEPERVPFSMDERIVALPASLGRAGGD